MKGRQGEKITGPYPWVQCLSHRQVGTLTSHRPLHLLHPMTLKNSTINSNYSKGVIRGLLGSFKSSTKVIDSTFPSCIKPLFKSETKGKTIKVIIMKMIFHSHVKNSFSQARFCSSLILKVKVFGTWKITAYCKSFEVNISKKVRKEN